MIYFSSDFHYGHENIAGPSCSNWSTGYRDFNSVAEMNQAIIDSLKVLRPGDELFYLGDWSFGSENNVEGLTRYFKRGVKLHLIYGNHDKAIERSTELQKCFDSVQYIWKGNFRGSSFYLHHFAQRVWDKSHHGTIHLYGHSHGTIPDYGLSMDVGFDTCKYGHEKYTLYPIHEVMEIMANRELVLPNRHGNE
jgi:calcineurin-like phosphoesterase family protein